jgi:tRNA(Ile2)-agmatinylcytidine synthase
VPAPLLLAFDDTDGPDGGCTTHLVFHVLLALPELALRSMPRLVRLCPNVPWKTRGNGAVVLDLGYPEGPQTRVGELRGSEVLAFPDSAPAPAEAWVLERVWDVVSRQARPDAQPAVVLFDEAPANALYWEAVTRIVDAASVAALLGGDGALHRSRGTGRALVGCTAAAAWAGPPSSFEFIAYREPQRWGTPRAVDPAPLRSLDATGATFHTWDPEADRPACIPNTPCPVLAGLRGRDPEALLWAATHTLPDVLGEPVDGWLLWATNQASGDHVLSVDALAEPLQGATIELAATVVSPPESRPGGHVFIAMQDGTEARFEAVAFEPTGGFREVVRALRPGDAVTVVGALEGPDGDEDAGGPVVKLEKIQIRILAPQPRKLANPVCTCGDRMKSKGRDAGFRCPSCGATAAVDTATWIEAERELKPGWHEVPVRARRHLHLPTAWGPV